MKNYKDLLIWRKGIELVKEVYKVVKFIPETEKYGLISQMTRAAVSIPANIAEGSGRNSDKDYSRFIDIALGSCFELQTYLVITKELKWIEDDAVNSLEQTLDEEIKMTHNFLRTLRS